MPGLEGAGESSQQRRVNLRMVYRAEKDPLDPCGQMIQAQEKR